MGDLLRSLQTTAGERTFIGGTPEKGQLVLPVVAALVQYVISQIHGMKGRECQGAVRKHWQVESGAAGRSPWKHLLDICRNAPKSMSCVH